LYDVFFRQSRKPNKTQSMAFNQTEFIFLVLTVMLRAGNLQLLEKKLHINYAIIWLSHKMV